MIKTTTLTLVVLLSSCAEIEGLTPPNGKIVRTANDLQQVICEFHTRAHGPSLDHTDTYVGDGSVASRRAQRDCYEQDQGER